jgi:5'(3')-deoxyribonucleotidase
MQTLWVIFGAALSAAVIMLVYHSARARAAQKRLRVKKAGPLVAVDIDGVLANQIDGILPRIQKRLGIRLSYDAITEWRLPLNGTDIAEEINAALDDDDYILSMPVHSGAQHLVNGLYPRATIDLVTARPPRTRSATLQWLSHHGFTFDELVNIKIEKKSSHRPDFLVDDYIGNIKEYLANTRGTAILVSQPWNKVTGNDRELAEWVASGRLYIASDLHEVEITLLTLMQSHRQQAVVAKRLNTTKPQP